MKLKQIITGVSLFCLLSSSICIGQEIPAVETLFADAPNSSAEDQVIAATPLPTHPPIVDQTGEACINDGSGYNGSMYPGRSGYPTTGKHATGWRKWLSPRNRTFVRFVKDPRPALPPVGHNVNAFWNTQISNGQEALMVLYHYDFVVGQEDLNPRGHRQLQKIARYIGNTPHPITIQPSEEGQALDQKRLAYVVNVLHASGIQIAPGRVILRLPPTRGLDGADAVPIGLGLQGLIGGSASGGTSNSSTSTN